MIDSNSKKVDSQKLTENSLKYFPPKINDFTFVKEFYPDKRVRHFDFAIYENENGKRVVAKQWNKSCKYIDYFWLINEINVYKEIHRVVGDFPEISRKYPTIKIPKLFGVFKKERSLTILIEEIDGQSIKILPVEKQIEIFQDVIGYLFFLGGKMDRSAKNILIRRSFWYIAAMFPPIFIIATINNPKKLFYFLSGAASFFLNFLRIDNKKDEGLVHRDLSTDHLIIKQDSVWVIDFQVSVIANPAFEIIGLMSNLWKNSDISEDLKKRIIEETVKNDKNRFYAYKTLSIYTAFYNLGVDKSMTSEQAISYLNYSLSLKFEK